MHTHLHSQTQTHTQRGFEVQQIYTNRRKIPIGGTEKASTDNFSKLSHLYGESFPEHTG